MSRNRVRIGILLPVLVAILIGVAIVTIRLSSSTSPSARDSGALIQAVSCLRGGAAAPSCSTSETISTNPAQGATIQADGQTVTWFSGDGREWQTTVASETNLLRLFANYGFRHYRVAASPVGGTVWSVILPNLILLIVIPLVVVLAVLVVWHGTSHRLPAASALREVPLNQCSFCGRLDPGPWGLVRGPAAAICGPCADRAAAQLRDGPSDQ